MIILKWICFILLCTDVVAYVGIKVEQIGRDIERNFLSILFLILGILARVFVLYGAATCWLLN